jgi:hypothetical protein
MKPARSVVPGDALLHPLALLALATWAVNDHVLKAQWPGAITGKLSDVAGLLVFPLVLQAAVEVVGTTIRRPTVLASRRVLLVAIVASGVVFSAVQLFPVAGEAYRFVWGWLAWPLDGFPRGRPAGVTLTQDPTDVLVLPVLLATWVLGRARTRQLHGGDARERVASVPTDPMPTR